MAGQEGSGPGREERDLIKVAVWSPKMTPRTFAEKGLADVVVVPTDAAAALEHELDVDAVAESTVCPDLDGLSAELARRQDHAH